MPALNLSSSDILEIFIFELQFPMDEIWPLL